MVAFEAGAEDEPVADRAHGDERLPVGEGADMDDAGDMGAVIDQQFDTTDVFIFFPLSGIDARYKSRFGLVK